MSLNLVAHRNTLPQCAQEQAVMQLFLGDNIGALYIVPKAMLTLWIH